MSDNAALHDILVPVLPESIADAVVISWYKQPGEMVTQDEPIVDIETDKVVLEVPAPSTGKLDKIIENEGSIVVAQQVLGAIAETDEVQEPAQVETKAQEQTTETLSTSSANDDVIITPAAQKLIVENQLQSNEIIGTGKGGRVLKEDVLDFMAKQKIVSKTTPEAPAKPAEITPKAVAEPAQSPVVGQREEKRVPMTRLRATIAQRLVEAQHTAAILTTFNEVNMQPIMDLRTRYKELFEKTHGVKLGFMSFFVKAAVEALKQFPAVNASIDGQDIIYHDYFDIGVAVSSPRGLVVPVLRDAQSMSMADIEKTIKSFGIKAKENQLAMEDLTGGTFSISNGGVFGSLLSTPILNPPQSGILGMHKIDQRPVAEDGQVVIRPVMYLALSYDHRIIDGREAVQFLVAIKNAIEDPARLLLAV